MTIKNAKPSSVSPETSLKPAKVKKAVAIKPGLKAHQEVLAHIEHRIGKTGDEEQDALLQTIAKNLKWRMKPWTRVVVTYVEE